METNTSNIAFDIHSAPDYAFLDVRLPANTTIKVEASSMATMDTNIAMKTKFKGGFKRFLTGESIFINEFTAQNATGRIGIAPSMPGDLRHIHLEANDTVYLQNSAFLASSMGINVESKWQGLMRGIFSGEGLFLIRCTGQGDLFFNSYGAIMELDVNDGYIVDTGNIVAFTGGLEYDIVSVGSYKSLFLSGEGLVAKFRGSGKIWIQTKKVRPLVWWASPFRPQKG